MPPTIPPTSNKVDISADFSASDLKLAEKRKQ
jgi:hypothetical protein